MISSRCTGYILYYPYVSSVTKVANATYNVDVPSLYGYLYAGTVQRSVNIDASLGAIGDQNYSYIVTAVPSRNLVISKGVVAVSGINNVSSEYHTVTRYEFKGSRLIMYVGDVYNVNTRITVVS